MDVIIGRIKAPSFNSEGDFCVKWTYGRIVSLLYYIYNTIIREGCCFYF